MDVVKMRWGQLEVNQVLDLHETYILDVSMQKAHLPFHYGSWWTFDHIIASSSFTLAMEFVNLLYIL